LAVDVNPERGPGLRRFLAVPNDVDLLRQLPGLRRGSLGAERRRHHRPRKYPPIMPITSRRDIEAVANRWVNVSKRSSVKAPRSVCEVSCPDREPAGFVSLNTMTSACDGFIVPFDSAARVGIGPGISLG
jgi:hypothetical protein